MRLIQSAWQTA